jgi:type I restriction enzyme R subunit
LLFKDNISEKDRERLKQASQGLLSSLRGLLAQMPEWLRNATTQAEVKVFILDRLYETLPRPPFTETETEEIADRVYNHIWQQSATATMRALQ